MKHHWIWIMFLLVGGLVSGCGIGASDESTDVNCHSCHNEDSEIGNKILNAQMGYEFSVHANGPRVPIIGVADTTATAPEVLGWYWSGSNALMGNGSSCQPCHTHEGFLNNIHGEYPDRQAIADEVILNPSPPGCFTCHAPHKNGNFTLNVPAETPVRTMTQALYDKPKGSICVTCHYAKTTDGRVFAYNTVMERIAFFLRADVTRVAHFGAHYSSQGDINLGVGGANYSIMSYGNSSHSSEPEANCVTCHMNLRTDMMGHLSAGFGGHSFGITGNTGDTRRGAVGGCEGCHDTVGRKLNYKVVGDAGAEPASGYLWKGKVYYVDTEIHATGGDAAGVIPARNVSVALSKLADPDNACTGLLATAFTQVSGGGVISWSNDVYNRCHLGYAGTYTIPAAPGVTADGITGAVTITDEPALVNSDSYRLMQALWNFYLINESDQSMGAHNYKYTLQLLHDTCADLKSLTGDTLTDCGSRP